jgi:hypothetical protein
MAEGSPERSPRAETGEIATSTLAEIYAQQGLLGRALTIYRRMLARTPEDHEIAGRIQVLERRIAEVGPEPEPGGSTEPPVERERLPWDPPRNVGGEESGVQEPAPMADRAAGPATDEAAAPATRRVGPIDSRAFEAWLAER